jgi:hypothetical protein
MGFIGGFLRGILQDLVLEGIRFTGVCVLYLCGHILKLFSPQSIAYSFDALWYAKFDKRDSSLMSIEKTGQIITGAAFIGVIILGGVIL